MISYLAGPLIGNARAGFTADASSVPVAIWSGGIVCVLCVVATGLVLPRFRRYRGAAAAPGCAGGSPGYAPLGSEARCFYVDNARPSAEEKKPTGDGVMFNVIKMAGMKSLLRRAAAAAGCIAALAVAAPGAAQPARTQAAAALPVGAPTFQVDASWPKQLPNNWIIGQVGGLIVDRNDHIWVLHRPRSNTVDELGAAQVPPRSECCFPAPAVLQFDAAGNLLSAWGGPGAGYDWPTSEHGIWVDNGGNVWVGGNSATDRQVIKFTATGQFILQIGHPSSDPLNSLRTDILGQVAGITVDDAANEVYLADGYGNKRVAVYDSQTGAFKRLWGAYGNVPNDTATGAYAPGGPPATQFRNPVHCAKLSRDNLVYVCDRVNDRIQVFTKAGVFISEFFVSTATLGNGSVWDLNFSKDAAQKYLILVDGENNVIWTLDRASGALVGKQSHNGRGAGQFHWVHQASTDSQGNLYTGEVDTSKRLQKFVLKKE